MNVDQMVAVFRGKYPGSTDEQIGLYRLACEAEAAKPSVPVVEEPLELMPVIVVTPSPAQPTPQLGDYQSICQPLPPAPPVRPPADLRDELRKILLGTYGFYLRLPPATQRRIDTEDLSENELLGLIVHGN